MKKDKKVWICCFESIATPLFFSLFPFFFLFLWMQGMKVYMYAFFISLIGLVFTIFTFLWNIQFIIFKEDYFIFGNFFKKELCKIKYENMIVLTKRLDTIYFRPFKKIEETDKKKKRIH